MDFINQTPREREIEMTSMPGHFHNVPRRRRIWPWFLGAGVVLLIVCGIASVISFASVGGAVNTLQKEDAARQADVKIQTCAAQPFGMVEVKYSITNSGKTTRTYLPQFELVSKSDSTRIGTASGIEPDVKPGQTVKGSAQGSVQGSGGFKCLLIDA